MATRVSPQYNERAATEAASKLIELSGRPQKHKWLVKMLYLIERESFERRERPIIYETLCSMEQGQLVSITYDIIRNRAAHYGDLWKKHLRKDLVWRMHVTTQPENRELSAADLEIIEDVFREFGGMNENELGDYTHSLPEYKDPGKSSRITSYDELLAALGYKQEEIDRITEEIQQEALLDSLLGV